MSTETAEFPAATKTLGDQIAELSLKDAKILSDYLKEAYGIEPAAGGGVMMAMPAGGAGGGGGEAAAEQTEFTVQLDSFGDQKIGVIKKVKEMLGLGLKEDKEIVDGCPKTLKEGVSQYEANKIKEELEGAGAVIELKGV